MDIEDLEDSLEFDPEASSRAMRKWYRAVLKARLGREPTSAEIIEAMALSVSNSVFDQLEKTATRVKAANKKPRLVVGPAQKEADKLWVKSPELSARSVAGILNKRGLGDFDHLRKNIKKPK